MPAVEITTPPSRQPALNDPRWAPKLCAYDVTCRLANGSTTQVVTIAANSSAAINNLDVAFEGQLSGAKVRTLC